MHCLFENRYKSKDNINIRRCFTTICKYFGDFNDP